MITQNTTLNILALLWLVSTDTFDLELPDGPYFAEIPVSHAMIVDDDRIRRAFLVTPAASCTP